MYALRYIYFACILNVNSVGSHIVCALKVLFYCKLA